MTKRPDGEVAAAVMHGRVVGRRQPVGSENRPTHLTAP